MALVQWGLAADIDLEEWDTLLRSASDHNVYQGFRWGEMKRGSGWQPLRLIAQGPGDEVVGMLQILQRKVGPWLVGWASGGPVLGFPQTDPLHVLEGLPGVLSASGFASVRLDCYHPRDSATSYAFSRVFKTVRVRINSGFTSFVDLTDRGRRPSTNHSRNLKKALAEELRLEASWGEARVGEFVSLYDAMRRSKGVDLPDIHRGLAQLGKAFGPDVLTVFAYGSTEALSVALVVRSGTLALFIGGATTPEGRRLSAGHLVFESLFEELAQAGVESFDLGGMAPANREALGVDRFKLGFGGSISERMGEWDWTKGPISRFVMSTLVRIGARSR